MVARRKRAANPATALALPLSFRLGHSPRAAVPCRWSVRVHQPTLAALQAAQQQAVARTLASMFALNEL